MMMEWDELYICNYYACKCVITERVDDVYLSSPQCGGAGPITMMVRNETYILSTGSDSAYYLLSTR
jgi:hypothetical protein